jgi:hypothetical protein
MSFSRLNLNVATGPIDLYTDLGDSDSGETQQPGVGDAAAGTQGQFPAGTARVSTSQFMSILLPPYMDELFKMCEDSATWDVEWFATRFWTKPLVSEIRKMQNDIMMLRSTGDATTMANCKTEDIDAF